MGLDNLRRAYRATPLAESELDDDPILQVAHWIAEARDRFADPTEVNAMALATADEHGRPSVRTVLLTGIDECGVTFFTHRESRKARELRTNPYAALCLHWRPIFRQVRICGPCSEVSTSEIASYFARRPPDAKRIAWGFAQSTPIADRAALQALATQLRRLYPDDHAIPTPTTWTGYRVTPDEIELWQGDPEGLHDRFCWIRADGQWQFSRLQP
jgi:pyridoxamine 5'-phosphate oxidase